jgi:hypothetical protein
MKLNSIIRPFVFKHSRGSVNGLCRTDGENLIMHELRIIEITIRCCKETFFIIALQQLQQPLFISLVAIAALN